MTLLRFFEYLVILNGAILIAQSVRVIAVYSTVYALTKGDRRQLPLHVWLIATSFLIYVIGTSLLLVVSPDIYALSRVIFYGVAGAIGQYALFNVLAYERRRYSEATNFMDSQE